jgi:hypothetical protein
MSDGLVTTMTSSSRLLFWCIQRAIALVSSCAKSCLFGIGRHGLHGAIAARSSLVVILQ